MSSKRTILSADQLTDLKGLWLYSQKLGEAHPGYISLELLAVEFGVTVPTVKRHVARLGGTSRRPRSKKAAPATTVATAPSAEAVPMDLTPAEPTPQVAPVVKVIQLPEADGTGRKRSRFIIKAAN